MGIAALKVLSLKNKFRVLKYSVGSRLINSVPKGVKQSYEFLRWLESKSISFVKKGDCIKFDYPINDKKYSFLISENSSDSDVFKQIIIDEEYKYLTDLITKKNIQLNTIVDGGANVGYTSIYFSKLHSNASIIAMEPNTKTFDRLTRNIKNNQLENVTCLQKGLWNKDTYLKADHSFRDKQDWSFRLEETQNEAEKLFEVISIKNILTSRNWETIDLLKIDIEGGEKELFKSSENLDWLNQVKVIAIEIHDEFNCRENIERTLVKYDFELSYSGELTIGINQKITDSQIIK